MMGSHLSDESNRNDLCPVEEPREKVTRAVLCLLTRGNGNRLLLRIIDVMLFVRVIRI